jgi:hypothetical protein
MKDNIDKKCYDQSLEAIVNTKQVEEHCKTEDILFDECVSSAVLVVTYLSLVSAFSPYFHPKNRHHH